MIGVVLQKGVNENAMRENACKRKRKEGRKEEMAKVRLTLSCF